MVIKVIRKDGSKRYIPYILGKPARYQFPTRKEAMEYIKAVLKI